jgi:hypothetical protein
MANVKSGFVGTLPVRTWRIEDSVGNLLCTFDSLAFPGFRDGSPVYFVDDLAPLILAENVQARDTINQLVAMATPHNGATELALEMLHDHAMAKMMANSLAQSAGAVSLVPQIKTAMSDLASQLNANWQGRATVNALRSIGL